jgi:hypothetical protein
LDQKISRDKDEQRYAEKKREIGIDGQEKYDDEDLDRLLDD